MLELLFFDSLVCVDGGVVWLRGWWLGRGRSLPVVRSLSKAAAHNNREFIYCMLQCAKGIQSKKWIQTSIFERLFKISIGCKGKHFGIPHGCRPSSKGPSCSCQWHRHSRCCSSSRKPHLPDQRSGPAVLVASTLVVSPLSELSQPASLSLCPSLASLRGSNSKESLQTWRSWESDW